MVPDEQPPVAAGKSDLPNPKGPRRRSRRGGRRHSRRRQPANGESPNPAASKTDADPSDESIEDVSTGGPVDEVNEPEAFTEPDESPLPDSPSPSEIEKTEETRSPFTRHPEDRQKAFHREPEHFQSRQTEVKEKDRSISTAIEQVNKVIADLKTTLEEMEDVLETLELAERQKISDERELENLHRSLRRLNRPRGDESHRP
ncbi:MAG: hypothetical protein U1F83_16130 [Verrucomicrobiota bacterium]